MIDIKTEIPIRLHEAAKLAGQGRAGRPIHVSTVLRWVLAGIKNPAGEVIHLDAARMGDHWITTREALQRFSQALTPNVYRPSIRLRAPGRRHKANERAKRRLENIGI